MQYSDVPISLSPRVRPILMLSLVALGLLALLGSPRFTAPALAQGQEKAAPKSLITINLKQTQGTIYGNAFGLDVANQGNNAPELMNFFRTPAGQQAYRTLGFRTMNYGTDSDDWAHPYNMFTAVPSIFPDAMLTDEFLHLAQNTGSEPMVAVNITATCHQTDPSQPASAANVTCAAVTPQIASDWLNYVKGLGIGHVQYVQLGTEPYAGCLYWRSKQGLNCLDKTGHHRIALPQELYASRVKQWASALKAVDPTIKVGLHLQPNTYQCQKACNKGTWDQFLLKKVGKKVDFVITHQYYVLNNPAFTPAQAQKYSYYQQQIDMRVLKNGVTATPTQIRRELQQWLPAKANMPIVIGEFNAALMVRSEQTENIDVRMSLYAGFSEAEAALDLVAPVKAGANFLPGAQRTIFHDLNSLPAMLAHFLPVNTTQAMVYSPAWYMFSAIQNFQGKTWVSNSVTNNPLAPPGLPTLRVYSVKQGKDLYIAVFNHGSKNAIKSDITLSGGKPLSATSTVIGDTAGSFLTTNTEVSPLAISASTLAIPSTQIKATKLSSISFPAHSLTVLHVTLK